MKDNFLKNRDIAIVAHAGPKLERRSGKSVYEFACAVFAELLERTGLKPGDIDGLCLSVPMSECGNPFLSNFFADYFGVTPRWLQTTDLGGCSAIGNVA